MSLLPNRVYRDAGERRASARRIPWMSACAHPLPVSLCECGAAGLRVSPAGLMLQNIIPGKAHDIYTETGIRFTICNDDEVGHTYVFSTHRPSESGRWEKGYTEIPDPHWCWFGRHEIAVGPNGECFCSLLVKVPAEERYYNQHWAVTLSIMRKHGDQGAAPAVNVRAQIETESREQVREKLAGAIGLLPSILDFSGAGEQKRVTVCNNGSSPRKLTIQPLREKEKMRTYLTAGFRAMAEPERIKITPGSVSIPAGESRTVVVEVPPSGQAAQARERYEYILWVEGNESSQFLRVRTGMGEQ